MQRADVPFFKLMQTFKNSEFFLCKKKFLAELINVFLGNLHVKIFNMILDTGDILVIMYGEI